MSETTCKCPRCNFETIGIKESGAPQICPRCQQEGLTVYMVEKRTQVNENLGGGLFRKKPITEDR